MTPIEAALYLMTKSPIHRKWTVADIERIIIPPISLDQFRIFYDGGRPVGLVTWGFFSDEVSEGYVNRTRRLIPEDWRSGDTLWFVDFIAPEGGVLAMVRVLYEMFPETRAEAFYCRAKNQRRVSRYGRSTSSPAVDGWLPPDILPRYLH